MTVRSKSEFFKLSQQLVFGNQLRQWNWYNYLALNGEERPARVSVRNCLAGGSNQVQRYRLTPVEATNHCLQLLRNHVVRVEDLILDESAPDDRVTLQAEVRNSERFIDMRYALDARGNGMRQSYEIMKHTSGLHAVEILRARLDAPSWDNLWRILAEYPNCVVELSAYEISVGLLEHNTIFWECREY